MGRILIVDDDQDFVNLLKKWLEEDGHEVFHAGEAFQAGEFMDKYRFDLAIIDVNIPHRNGLDLLRAIRNSVRFKLLPVIVVSSRQSKHDIAKAATLDVAGYLLKPIERKSFMERIQVFFKMLPARTAADAEIDQRSQIAVSEFVARIPVHVVRINDVGIVLESPKEIPTDVIGDLKSYIFTVVGIDSCPMRVLSAAHDEERNIHVTRLVFEKIHPDDLTKWKVFVSRQLAIGKPIA
ncbi:MAG TPA: response regulator [Pseudobdellovibrionaceae bacterium]|nr:response regulator [Pseudobdellovibrionaceae bacterium]